MVTARSTKWPDNLGQSASYVLHVCKGATGSAANVINSAGATAGAASNHPSFTRSLNTASNHQEVTPVGSTSGAFVLNVVTGGDANIQSDTKKNRGHIMSLTKPHSKQNRTKTEERPVGK